MTFISRHVPWSGGTKVTSTQRRIGFREASQASRLVATSLRQNSKYCLEVSGIVVMTPPARSTRSIVKPRRRRLSSVRSQVSSACWDSSGMLTVRLETHSESRPRPQPHMNAKHREPVTTLRMRKT